MQFARENVMSPKELAQEFELSEARLADLRSQRKGPPYFKFGGIWYPKTEFDEWIKKQMIIGGEDGVEEKERQVALPVPVQGARIHGQHRFGRHLTKHEGSKRNRGRGPEGSEEREECVPPGKAILPFGF
jgi:hypothetical protein